MKRRRLKLIIITTLIFSVALAATVIFVREINQQSETLRSQVETLQKDRAQQAQLARLKKLVQETEEDRSSVSSHYLESQSDGIDLLNYIENLAKEKSIALETTGATESVRDKQQVLGVRYNLIGDRAGLEQFIELLENIPYVSEVTSVNLMNNGPAQWEANVTMEVIVLETHETKS